MLQRLFFIKEATQSTSINRRKYLSVGNELNYICKLLDLKINTVHKAIRQGRLIIPEKKMKNRI
jgi:hypothetical protein